MYVDWDKIETKDVSNFAGGIGTLKIKTYVDDYVTLFNIIMPPKTSIGSHVHEPSMEVAYTVAGEIVSVEEDGSFTVMQPGQWFYCPRGKAHMAVNVSDKDAQTIAIIPKRVEVVTEKLNSTHVVIPFDWAKYGMENK